MSTEFRALGTAIYFESATDIALTVTLTGTGTATINASDSAYLTIPAGSTWRLPDLCNYVAFKTRAWLFAAITADAGVTKSSFVITDLTVSWAFTPSLTVNGSRLALTISYTGGAHLTIGGTNAAITAVSLTNTNGLWTKFGLVTESSSSQAMSVAGGVATRAGDMQPRSIFCFLRSEIDEGDTEETNLYKVLKTTDGAISTFESGRHTATRRLRLVDLDEDIAGRPKAIARIGDSGVESDRVTFNMNQVSGEFSSGVTNSFDELYNNATEIADLVSNGNFVLVPGVWVSRGYDGDASSVLIYDKIPASITVPDNGSLLRISEVHALFFEAMRTGYLFVFDMVETPGSTFGSILWLSTDYALAESGSRWEPERRDIGLPVYSYTFNLIRRDASGITQTSNA